MYLFFFKYKIISECLNPNIFSYKYIKDEKNHSGFIYGTFTCRYKHTCIFTVLLIPSHADRTCRQAAASCLPNDRWWVFSIAQWTGPGAICHRLSRNKPSMEMNLFIHIKQPARAAAYTLNMHHSNNCSHSCTTHIQQQQHWGLSCRDQAVMTAKYFLK